MATSRSAVRLLQVTGALALAGGVVLCLLELLAPAAGRDGGHAAPLVRGLGFLVFGGALGGLLAGLAGLLGRPSELPAEAQSALESLGQSVRRLGDQLEQIRLSNGTMRALEEEERAASAAPQAAAAPAIDSRLLERTIEVLEEIRELTMLTEAQRQQRLRQIAQQRKVAVLQQVGHCLQQQQWGRADHLLAILEQQVLGIDGAEDAEIAAARRQLGEGRAAVQEEQFQLVSEEVENQMAINGWDRAWELARSFADNYPGHDGGQHLLGRVARERQMYHRSAVQRLYEQFKREVENKCWRQALSVAQQLLEKFPDDPKSQKVRPQLKVIQDNAEIEERHEQEQRIQELIRGKRFSEAISLAEELMKQFPGSPQAQSLQDLLPRLRGLAAAS